MKRTALPFPASEKKFFRRRNIVERSDVVPNRFPSLLVQHGAAAAHAALVDAAPTFEPRTRDGDFANDVAISIEDLAYGPSQEFGNAITDVRPNNKEHAVTEAAMCQQERFEREDFFRSEGAGWHAPKIRSQFVGVTCADAMKPPALRLQR